MKKSIAKHLLWMVLGCGELSVAQDRAFIIDGAEDSSLQLHALQERAVLKARAGRLSGPDLLCTAVLISERFALTAAHCVTENIETWGDQPLEVVSPQDFGLSVSDRLGARLCEFEVAEIHVHPRVRPRLAEGIIEDDLALLELAETAWGCDGVVPVWPAHTSTISLVIDEQVTAAGFGRLGRDRLWADLRVQNTFDELWVLEDQDTGFLEPGDSGGPLFRKIGNRIEVVGINSTVVPPLVASVRLDRNATREWISSLVDESNISLCDARCAGQELIFCEDDLALQIQSCAQEGLECLEGGCVCACDLTEKCQQGCGCDLDCGCECDADETCTEGCGCDIECEEAPPMPMPVEPPVMSDPESEGCTSAGGDRTIVWILMLVIFVRRVRER